jgi:hypothetical protein
MSQRTQDNQSDFPGGRTFQEWKALSPAERRTAFHAQAEEQR